MVKGLLARGDRSDPGKRLEEKDAPALYSVLRDVAAKVDTPMVDSVFLVPDATVAVFERGSTLKHLRHRGERCLLMGIGVLDGMSLGQLKAILAHEYGHLSNRDTAGGGLALQVRRSILTSAEALASGGAAVWYNPAWLFLNGFFRLYLRISQGASRLQEVLADRWAVLAYGKDAFSSGLRHVVRRGIEFDFLSRREITQAVRESRPLHNLYDLQVPPQWSKGDEEAENGKPPAQIIEEAYQEALSAPTSDYDSHPAPAQRLAWVDRMTGAPSPTPETSEAWSLFPEKGRIQELMTSQVGARLQAFIARQTEIQASLDRVKPDEEVVSLGLDSRKP
jgi:Zn-dependent protease with chaperone function